MRYVTPRKAAVGMGASHTGTQHHWWMTVSSVALAVLTPSFLMVIGTALQLPERAEIMAYFSRPYPAIVVAIFMTLGMLHFIKGTRIMIDDYLDHTARKAALIAAAIFGWAVIAMSLFALARLMLAPAQL
ncbi:succinate dehydrogenase / fumarate reductase membrane anchor subunit [Paracoccus isoporae]|uniref:Succinate dehydrogenase / fumarate reductase membrane anchor subunit n=1 Tax=Paracoccus isoporae TaxID=591205 RepID=A0A1G7A5Q3_9RHOB|nr:succinate dehydrogenase [Paracoccus isoporae]SDE10100.1 succinate dehydrogenase / fumarate reductase membrane anchor subunit [Paracoccus isoporae]